MSQKNKKREEKFEKVVEYEDDGNLSKSSEHLQYEIV
jgi:hypothetical protein